MSLLNKIQKIFTLPQMHIFWSVVPMLAIVAVLQYVFISGIPLAIGLLLLGGTATLVFVFCYQAAVVGYNASIEKSELKGIMGGLEDALIVYNPNFTILFFNAAATKLFSLKSQDIEGKTITPKSAAEAPLTLLTQVIYPSLAPGMVNRSPAGTYPQTVDISFTDPLLELRITTSKVLDEQGNLLGFVKLVRDRTRELSVIKSKNEFITTASHQLRTPLTEISWAAEALASEKEGMTDTAKTIIENLRNSSHELIAITEDLLNIAKLEEGHFGYNFAPTDVIAFLTQILTDIHPLIQKAGLKLYFDKPQEAVAPVMIDTQKLALAINNLLENAIRYNTKDGQITVKVERIESMPYVKISIKDTGIGIPQQELDKLFTKFFRAENAVRFETKGSGLGLYIVKNIIRGHGGDVAVSSEVNRGTIISFTLPTDPSLVPQREVAMEL